MRVSTIAAFLALSVPPAIAQRDLPAEVDAAQIHPDGEIGASTIIKSLVVKSGIVKSNIGAYRESGRARDDRMAWYFRTGAAGDFVRLTLRFPDDAPRICEIFQIADSGAYWTGNSLGAGYVTGFAFPRTSKSVTQSFDFWVSSAPQFGIVFKSSMAGAPCAVESLRLEKLDAGTVPRPPAETRQPGRRKMGLFAEDPVLSSTYGDHVIADDAHVDRFTRPLERQITYLKRTLQNLVIYPAVWYTQALYQPSSEFPPGMKTNRAHPSNYDELMASRYADEHIDFWPSIRNWLLPSLASWLRKPDEILNGGEAAEYVNAVYVDPIKLTANVRTNSGWHSPPELNALHPRVRAAIKSVVAEIAGRIGRYSSFRGILLWTGLHSSHSLGLMEQSYDDYSVKQFARENHLDLPPSQAADRFSGWYVWIRDHHRNEWLRWRQRSQTKFYGELADAITAKNPNAKLQIMVQYPIPTEGYDYDHGREVTDVASYLAKAGIDLQALAANPAIVISRWYDSLAYESHLRGSPPDSPDMLRRLAGRHLDFDPAWQAPFLDKTAGAILQRTYFEADFKPKPRLDPPPFWKSGSEITWQVTSPMGAGRQALEYISKSIALYDLMFVAQGGFQKGGNGAEDLLPAYAAAFTSLPAVRFHPLSNQDDTVFREGQAEGARWYYVVNAAGVEKTVTLRFPSGGHLQTLGLKTETVAIQTGHTLRVTLPAYDLQAWKLTP